MEPQDGRSWSDVHRDLAGNLPRVPIDLSSVTSILFIPERAPFEKLIPNLLSAAALYRAVALERCGEPRLKVVGEVLLTNWTRGFAQVPSLDTLYSGERSLFLCSTSLYKREFAVLFGMHAVSEASLLGVPQLVDDAVPLGLRPDHREPLAPFARRLVGSSGDHIVQQLLALADGDASSNADKSLLTDLSLSLSTLGVRAGLLSFRETGERIDPFEKLHELIVELSSGAREPRLCRMYKEDYMQSRSAAEAIWSDARQIAPGVFELEGIPFSKRDSLVRSCLQQVYLSDPTARYVLEKNDDQTPHALSLAECVEFSNRLAAGESPELLLREIVAVLKLRKDDSTLTSISLQEERDIESAKILSKLLEDGQYIPDPDGCYVVLKKPTSIDVTARLENGGVPLVNHKTLWLVDPKTNQSKRTTVVFQVQHLTRFLDCVLEADKP